MWSQLPLDVKCIIARDSVAAWRALGADPEFGRFAIDQQGRDEFTRTFTVTINGRWTINGIRHRADGPAIAKADGSTSWYYRGRRHRVDGPAVTEADGSTTWYYRGRRHRVDGPAVANADGSTSWYYHGQLHRLDGPAITRQDGTTLWYCRGQFHREDGPAITEADGSTAWYYHGQTHRKGGPAVTKADGSTAWYYHGQIHREDGPAVTHADGSTAWYHRGAQLIRAGAFFSTARIMDPPKVPPLRFAEPSDDSSGGEPATPGALMSPYDPSDCVYESIACAPSGHFVAMPESFVTRGVAKSPRNQGKRGTCAAFTASTCAEIHSARAGDTTPLSPEFIYYHRDNRSIEGMCGRNVFQIMQHIGIVPERDYPYRRDELAPAPDEALYAAASQRKIANYARITSIDGLKRALLEIGPCYLQLPLYSARPEFWRKSHGETAAGGHAVAVVGYTKRGFILQNSWGARWGPSRDGHIVLPYADWIYVRECWVPVPPLPHAIPSPPPARRCSVQ